MESGERREAQLEDKGTTRRTRQGGEFRAACFGCCCKDLRKVQKFYIFFCCFCRQMHEFFIFPVGMGLCVYDDERDYASSGDSDNIDLGEGVNLPTD